MSSGSFRARTSLALLTPLLALGGCGGAAAPEELGHTVRSAELDLNNGTSLNGTSMNGTSMNGTSMNGTSMNGISLNGMTLNGTSMNGVWLSGTTITGYQNNAISGAGLVGALLVGSVSDGTTVSIRIDAVIPLLVPNTDLSGYGLSYQTSTGWSPLCGLEVDGTEVLAIPMSGTWNYTSGTSSSGTYSPYASGITFACRHHAIAKCVEMGYRPWLYTGNNGQSAANYTVACTRLLRADYCGNGVSYTVDGTLIDLFDNEGVQVDTEPLWPIEAAWNQSGSTCVSVDVQGRFLNTGMVPTCLNPDKKCGTKFNSGALIVDRYLYTH